MIDALKQHGFALRVRIDEVDHALLAERLKCRPEVGIKDACLRSPSEGLPGRGDSPYGPAVHDGRKDGARGASADAWDLRRAEEQSSSTNPLRFCQRMDGTRQQR